MTVKRPIWRNPGVRDGLAQIAIADVVCASASLAVLADDQKPTSSLHQNPLNLQDRFVPRFNMALGWPQNKCVNCPHQIVQIFGYLASDSLLRTRFIGVTSNAIHIIITWRA